MKSGPGHIRGRSGHLFLLRLAATAKAVLDEVTNRTHQRWERSIRPSRAAKAIERLAPGADMRKAVQISLRTGYSIDCAFINAKASWRSRAREIPQA